MIIAVVHGYLLQGTGSNLYVSNLCRIFCLLGHHVILFSQEAEPGGFDFISSSEVFNEDNQTTNVKFERSSPYPGSCTHYRPHLAGLLPVYVYDHYPGFVVKEFPALSERELENYIERNRVAIETGFRKSAPDLVISQHTIMQPAYTGRALSACSGHSQGKSRHLITIHGSALNFSVRKSRLLRRYALEGIESASGLVFVSNHSRNDFTAYFSDLSGLEKKCHVIFAGVNTALFQPLCSLEKKEEQIEELQSMLRKAAAKKSKGKRVRDKKEFQAKLKAVQDTRDINAVIDAFQTRNDIWAPDHDAADNLGNIDWQKEHIVLYYGKYLWTKGIHLLLAAMPLVLQKYPQARLILVGFGSAREYLEAIVEMLNQGKLDLALEMITNPKLFNLKEANNTKCGDGLIKLLSSPRTASRYRDICKNKLAGQVTFTGIMDHEQLRKLIPCADVVVAPSIFPESFGLVGVEALACGILPVQTYHSGFADVVDVYEENFRDVFTTAGIRHLPLDEKLVPNLVANITALFAYLEGITAEERINLANRAHRLADKHFSWDKIAGRYLEL